MLIDCDRCRVRGAGCADCLVTVLLDADADAAGAAPGAAEQRAIEVFARAGFDVEVLPPEPAPAPTSRRRVGRRRAA